MAMTGPKYVPIKVARMRFSRLDAAGATPAGASNAFVGGAQQIVAAYNVEEGESETIRDGDDNICLTVEADDKLTAIALTIDVCNFNAEQRELLVGGSLITLTGNTIGHQLPLAATAGVSGVAVEAWVRHYSGGSQTTDTNPQYIRFVWPRVKFVPGSKTLARTYSATQYVGNVSENPLIANGPFNDLPAGLIGSLEASFIEAVATLPATSDTYVTVPAQV